MPPEAVLNSAVSSSMIMDPRETDAMDDIGYVLIGTGIGIGLITFVVWLGILG